MAFPTSSVLFFLFLCFFFQTIATLSLSPTNRSSHHHFALILRTLKTPAATIPHPSSKIRFSHNVSLTVTLAVGTPPQNVSMVLDTGSELSWLLCSPSPSPSPSSPSFNPRSSASYTPIPCSSPTCLSQTRDLPSPATCSSGTCAISVSYADGSSSDGALATDTFHLTTTNTRTTFGCMTSAYSASAGDPLAAGILGMNRGTLSFVTQTATNKFSYCISDKDAAGVLLLGSRPDFHLPLNYTPLVSVSLPLPYFDRVAYSVQLTGIRVGTVLLPIPKTVLVPDHTGAGQTMIDSASQFTYLLGPAYTALKTEFLRQTRVSLVVLEEPDFVFQDAFDTCFLVAAGKLPPGGLPEVVLMFDGAEVAVVGERLLYPVVGERRGGDVVWCLTFGNSDLVPVEEYIIGHHHQQNVWVEYDLENKRVGFAPVRCDLASQQLGLAL